MYTLNVDLGERSYPIYIGSGILADKQLLRRHVSGKQVMLVTNEVVAPLYLDKVRAGYPGMSCSQVVLPDGEENKNLATLELVFDQLLAERHNRSTTIVALGGGVVGDMAGFAAACYQRGVNFVQVPTTLLAQVDSSVGGKTGVNHPLGKNMIGAFYQPQCVIIDTETLQTLPARHFRAGIAEVIKYGIIADREFFVWLESNYSSLLSLREDALHYAITRSCEIKARVVAQDERESGLREILNLGHTFGHAIETEQGYGEWLHGEAVAAGMVMAADLSVRMGLLGAGDGVRIRGLVEAVGLPALPPEAMTEGDFLARMAVDKKVITGDLRLVLIDAIGKARVTADIDSAALSRTFAAGQSLCGSL